MEKIFEFFGWTNGQICRFWDWVNLFKNFSLSGFSLKRFFAGIMAILECFGCILFDTPVSPNGQALDLTGYSLVFEDEFEGDSLDTDAWFYRGVPNERGGHNSASQVRVENGNLIITGEHLENGEYGAGWYTEEIALRELYCKGYFEIKCICSESDDFWSAFWIQSSTSSPYNHYASQGGVNGAEIDIFEAMSADKILKGNRNAITTTIHCNGVDDDIENIDSLCLGDFKGKNIYREYNTYGLEWTDDEYIFYINGVETSRSSFGKGVSQIPEMVLISLCAPSEFDKPLDYKTEFIVDSVRIYQK